MTTILLAPLLDEHRELALAAIDRAFAAKGGRSPSQAYTDALKLAEAERVLAGEPGALLVAEAEIRGVAIEALAEAVLLASAAAREIELERQRLKQAVRQAPDHREITRLLAAAAIPLI